MARIMRSIFLLLGLALIASPAWAADEGDKEFGAWLTVVREDARREGISEATLDDAFQDAEVDEHVLALDKKQPEKTITLKNMSAMS